MTKPLVFNYKDHEELRAAYKDLLADNRQLMSDNRKLRQEVTELKQLKDGYEKIIAKNQETNNKLMASVQKQTGGDLISRADAIEAVRKELVCDGRHEEHDKVCRFIADVILSALPSAELPKGDLISRADVLKYPIRLDHYDEKNGSREFVYGVESVIEYVESLPSADAPNELWKDGTLVVKVPNAKEVGRVFVQDEDENVHIGGGLFYPDDAVHGKWLPIEETLPTYDGGEKTWLTGMKCSNCGKLFDLRVGYHYCPSCGARMKGGDTE